MELRPIEVRLGPDVLLLREAVQRLRQSVVTRAADFNSDELSARHAQMKDVLHTARTLPMMAERRWLHVSELEQLPAKEHELLVDYTKDPAPRTVLVLSGEKLDQRTKLARALKPFTIQIEPPARRALPDWLRQRARMNDVAIDSATADVLIEMAGTDCGVLTLTLSQLATFVHPRAIIELADVEGLLTASPHARIFTLTDTLGAHDPKVALTTARALVLGGTHPLVILNMLARQVRLLIAAQAGRALPVPPGIAQRIKEQARGFSEGRLAKALAQVAEADLATRMHGEAAPATLDRLLLELAEPR